MKHRHQALFVAVMAFVGYACGGTPAPTPTSSPTGAANPTTSSTTGPALTSAPSAGETASATSIGTPTAEPPSGQMTQGRSAHTATALADGRVLLAGGYFQDLPITSVDLYDPQTEAFTATGPMATARGFDTATLLDDGRVLIAGGNPGNWNFTGPLISSAELYDPATGTFSATGSMTTARDFHVATLLRDGRVLVTGGSRHGMDSASGQFLTSAEIYDPKTGTFSVTGSMKSPRASHTATLLSDGRVLISGGAVSVANGQTGTNSLASAELYDPTTGKFSATGSMADARTFQQATLLAHGRVLVTGGDADGWSYAGHYLASAEVYDARAQAFAVTGSMADVRTYHTATMLPDGRVLIAGGFDGFSDLATAELYDPKTGAFSPLGN